MEETKLSSPILRPLIDTTLIKSLIEKQDFPTILALLQTDSEEIFDIVFPLISNYVLSSFNNLDATLTLDQQELFDEFGLTGCDIMKRFYQLDSSISHIDLDKIACILSMNSASNTAYFGEIGLPLLLKNRFEKNSNTINEFGLRLIFLLCKDCEVNIKSFTDIGILEILFQFLKKHYLGSSHKVVLLLHILGLFSLEARANNILNGLGFPELLLLINFEVKRNESIYEQICICAFNLVTANRNLAPKLVRLDYLRLLVTYIKESRNSLSVRAFRAISLIESSVNLRNLAAGKLHELNIQELLKNSRILRKEILKHDHLYEEEILASFTRLSKGSLFFIKQTSLKGNTSKVIWASFHPTRSVLGSCSMDGSITLWNPESGEVLKTLNSTTPVKFIHFQGNLLVGSGFDKSITVWDIDLSTQLAIFEMAHSSSLNCAVLHPLSSFLASCGDDGFVKIWDLEEKQLLRGFEAHGGGFVSCLSFSHDGEIMATGGSDHFVKIWGTKGELVQTLKGHSKTVIRVLFHPTKLDILVSSSADHTIRFWNYLDGEMLRVFPSHRTSITCMAFHPSGNILVSCSHEEETVKFWNVRNGQVLQTVISPTVSNLSFHPNGSLFSSCGGSNSITLWKVFEIE